MINMSMSFALLAGSACAFLFPASPSLPSAAPEAPGAAMVCDGCSPSVESGYKQWGRPDRVLLGPSRRHDDVHSSRRNG